VRGTRETYEPVAFVALETGDDLIVFNFTKMEAQRWWLGGFGAAWAASGSTRSVDEVSIRQPERGG